MQHLGEKMTHLFKNLLFCYYLIISMFYSVITCFIGGGRGGRVDKAFDFGTRGRAFESQRYPASPAGGPETSVSKNEVTPQSASGVQRCLCCLLRLLLIGHE